MGKGDKKSRRGKIRIGSSGVRRPRKKKRSHQVMIKAPVVKPAEILEEKPVVVVPVPEIPVVQEQKPIPEKPKQKKAPAIKPTEILEEKPVAVIPAVEMPVIQEQKPAPEKPKQKKAPAKKPAEKPEKEEPKPKTPKPKKKTE